MDKCTALIRGNGSGFIERNNGRTIKSNQIKSNMMRGICLTEHEYDDLLSFERKLTDTQMRIEELEDRIKLRDERINQLLYPLQDVKEENIPYIEQIESLRAELAILDGTLGDLHSALAKVPKFIKFILNI